MADGDDVWPFVVAAFVAAVVTLGTLAMAAFSGYVRVFVGPALYKYINTMAKAPYHYTTAMVITKVLGLETTEDMDFFAAIADSDAITKEGYSALTSTRGLYMEVSSKLAAVVFYNFYMVFGHYPSEDDPLPSKEDIDALGAKKRARDAKDDATHALAFIKSYALSRRQRAPRVPPILRE